MSDFLGSGLLAAFLFAAAAQIGKTSASFEFKKIDPEERRTMIDSESRSVQKDRVVTSGDLKGPSPALSTSLKSLVQTSSGLAVISTGLFGTKSQLDATDSLTPDLSALSGTGTEMNSQPQLKRLVHSNSGVMLVPVEVPEMMSELKAVISGTLGTGIGSQAYYNVATYATTVPSTTRPSTSRMTSPVQTGTTTTAGYAVGPSAGQRVSCSPDFSNISLSGQCVTVDQIDQRCGTNFEAAQSTRDCSAFDGNWCCYIPAASTATPTRPGQPGSITTLPMRQSTPSASTSY